MASYDEMSLEELEALDNDFAQKRLELADAHQPVKDALNERRATDAARSQLANLNEAQRQALAAALADPPPLPDATAEEAPETQQVATPGVESTATVGTPGQEG